MFRNLLPIPSFALLAPVLAGCASHSATTADMASTDPSTVPSTPVPDSAAAAAGAQPTSTPTVMEPPPTPVTCKPPAVVCEDFESGSFSPYFWQLSMHGTGSYEMVQDRVAKGKYAMHIKTTGLGGSGVELTTTKFLGENFWGRMYVYFAAKPRNLHGVLFTGNGNLNGGYTAMRVATWNGQFSFLGYFSDNPHFDAGSNSSEPIPVGKWACFEWNLHPVLGADNHLWQDGKEIVNFQAGDRFSNRTTGTFKIAPFTSVAAGWGIPFHDDPDPQTEAWIDEIAFGPERIGCN